MIYFSEFQGRKVNTEDNIFIGILEDVIFLASENPQITKLVVRTPKREKLMIPIRFLIKDNGGIVVQKGFISEEMIENELSLLKNLLDKQIIDLTGNKIVRVNDVMIQEKPTYYISGVDIGFLGILRWFKLEKFFWKLISVSGRKITSDFLSWADIQPLELARGTVVLKQKEDKLKKLRPEDLADHLEKTNIENVDKILKILDEKFAADVINSLNINYQTALFKSFSADKAARILNLIDPDEAVDILLTLSPHRREVIIEHLDPVTKKHVQHLMRLSKTPIGEKLTTDFLSVSPDNTVSEVIDKLRRETPDFPFITYVYVINKENKLIGVFSLHELLLQQSDAIVYKFMMPNIIVAHLTTPEEIVIKRMYKYKIQAIPVIDENQQILGIVTFDSAAEFILNIL